MRNQSKMKKKFIDESIVLFSDGYENGATYCTTEEKTRKRDQDVD